MRTGVANGATACETGHAHRRVLDRAAVEDRLLGRLLGKYGNGRIALDDEIRLDHVVLPLGQVGQVEQALAVGGHECGDEDEGCDPVGAV